MEKPNEMEIVMHLLGPKVIVDSKAYWKSNPNPYFSDKYALMAASASTPQQKKALVESAHNIGSLVQNGLKPSDAILPKEPAIVVLGALYPLVPLVGQVVGVEDVVKTYMQLLCEKPGIPTEIELQSLAEDLCLP